MRDFMDAVRDRVLVFDGSKGYMLQMQGLQGGECPELWNITQSEKVKGIYQAYKDAGSDVIQTNTFTGSRAHLEKYSLGDRVYEINYAGTRLAREVMGSDGYVAASVGPTGRLFTPSGDLTFEEAYEVFREQVKAAADGGADLINFETFIDIAEMRAALLAAKETSDLPVVCSMAFEANGRTLMGSDSQIAAVVLKCVGADMVGANCSFGPGQLLDIIRGMSEAGGGCLAAKPNAGIPEVEDGKVIYRESPGHFSELTEKFIGYGVRLIGGCCGTTPDFVRAVKEKVKSLEAETEASGAAYRERPVITSTVRLLDVSGSGRIHAGLLTNGGDKAFAQAVAEGDMESVADLCLDLSAEDFDAVHICLDGIIENQRQLPEIVDIAQGYIKAPLILETGDAMAMEKALRLYKGRAGVITGNYDGRTAKVLSRIAARYGSAILTPMQ